MNIQQVVTQTSSPDEKVEYEEKSLELLQRENNTRIFEIIDKIQNDRRHGLTYQEMIKKYGDKHPDEFKQYSYFMKTAMQRELEPELLNRYRMLIETMNEGKLDKQNCDDFVSKHVFKKYYNDDKTPKNQQEPLSQSSNSNVQTISLQNGSTSTPSTSSASPMVKGFLNNKKDKQQIQKLEQQQQEYLQRRQQRILSKKTLQQKNQKDE